MTEISRELSSDEFRIDAHHCTAPQISLHWRHNENDGFSNHQPHDYLLNRLFRRRSKKASKLCVTDLCEGNSPVTGEFLTQKASNAKNVPFDDVVMWCVSEGYPILLSKIHVKFHVGWQGFSNVASDWLAAVLLANQMPGLKTSVNWYGYCNMVIS